MQISKSESSSVLLFLKEINVTTFVFFLLAYKYVFRKKLLNFFLLLGRFVFIKKKIFFYTSCES